MVVGVKKNGLTFFFHWFVLVSFGSVYCTLSVEFYTFLTVGKLHGLINEPPTRLAEQIGFAVCAK